MSDNMQVVMRTLNETRSNLLWTKLNFPKIHMLKSKLQVPHNVIVLGYGILKEVINVE